jgi:hypothetical protein
MSISNLIFRRGHSIAIRPSENTATRPIEMPPKNHVSKKNQLHTVSTTPQQTLQNKLKIICMKCEKGIFELM